MDREPGKEILFINNITKKDENGKMLLLNQSYLTSLLKIQHHKKVITNLVLQSLGLTLKKTIRMNSRVICLL